MIVKFCGVSGRGTPYGTSITDTSITDTMLMVSNIRATWAARIYDPVVRTV